MVGRKKTPSALVLWSKDVLEQEELHSGVHKSSKSWYSSIAPSSASSSESFSFSGSEHFV
ncbi:hypothetical protein ABEB36_004593 [Hypothenemus hampei]|uniref:Uncharacterized protein n=1 Tax=Hypothenemus hampei TaxID=57062 RepID=A0ABD1F459_HYPHA